jgi:phosphate transport system permease protein
VRRNEVLQATADGSDLSTLRRSLREPRTLFTALFSNYWLFQDGKLVLMEPTASLAVLIFNAV